MAVDFGLDLGQGSFRSGTLRWFMHLRFVYFNFPFWRAEVGRLALHLGGIPFEDVRPDGPTFRAQKADGAYPYGQLPVLEVDGVQIAQSAAIAAFCGKLAGLYPNEDALKAARVDELLATANQISYLVSPSVRERDPDTKKALRKVLGEETLPHWLGLLEARLERFGSGPYCLGEAMTVADIALWRLSDWLSSGILDGLPTTLLEPHARLKALKAQVEGREDVKAWMAQYV